MDKLHALAGFLDIDPDDISEQIYDNCEFDAGGLGDYLVLTDEEAELRAVDSIRDSLWAFNADFLSGYTGLPACVFESMQNQCEGANDAFIALIESTSDLESFAAEAISADGRGHFIASYDSDENESGDYFIYRTN